MFTYRTSHSWEIGIDHHSWVVADRNASRVCVIFNNTEQVESLIQALQEAQAVWKPK
jgi:hypothetical protein